MSQVHDIDADSTLNKSPLSENPAARAAAATAGRPDATGSSFVPDPFLNPPPAMNPRTMYICASVVAFGLLMVAAGLLFGRGRSEARPTVAAPVANPFTEQQRMAREAMSMAREAQQMQRERLDLMRQQMKNAESGFADGADATVTDPDSAGD